MEVFVRDRLFCRRTGGHVPYSLEVHPSSIGNDLSIKVRVDMHPSIHENILHVEEDFFRAGTLALTLARRS